MEKHAALNRELLVQLQLPPLIKMEGRLNPMYALYTTDTDGRHLIGRYDTFEDGATALDAHRFQNDGDNGYELIREDDDDGTRV